MALACLSAVALLASVAFAAQPPVGLGTDTAFAVLSGQAVTNTGSSVINGDLGVSPGSAISGFPPGTVNGTIYATDAVAAQAQLDLTTAYNTAAAATPATAVPADLTGLTLTPGVYSNATALGLSGALTLNAQGNPNAVFIFQAGSTLITGSGSSVTLINGAQPCNVYWQVGSSATLGTTSNFIGNILALSSITMNNGVILNGRALARNGAVTLIDDTITAPTCTTAATTTTTTAGTGTTTGASSAKGIAHLKTTPGSVAKNGTSLCITKKFDATVTGTLIKKVVFSFAGHVIATRKSSPYSTSVDPGSGTNALTARVTFTSGPAKTLNFEVKACAAAARSVGALKGSGGFTG